MTISVTHWTDIGRAEGGDESTWARLVAKYRPPVLAFLRAQGLHAQAEDLAQEVFLTLWNEGVLRRASPERGRFRALLLAVTRNVAGRHRAREGAQKRGGGARVVPLRDQDPPAPHEQDLFDREWALNLLDHALATLAKTHPRYHEAIAAYFLHGQSQPAVAEAMGRRVGDVRNYVHRGKQKLLELLREEVWQHCSDTDEFVDELGRLQQLWGLR